VELVTPTGMLLVLLAEEFTQWGAPSRMGAVIGADFALEDVDGAGRGAQGFVVPALDGRAAQHDPRAAEGVAPLLSGEFLELLLEFAAGRGRGQERSDDAEAKMRPAFLRPRG